jgi:hypothetical protein
MIGIEIINRCISMKSFLCPTFLTNQSPSLFKTAVRFAEPNKATPDTSTSQINHIHLQLGFLITSGIYCIQICQRSPIFDVANSPTVENLSSLPGATIQASSTHIELIFTAETEGSLDHTFILNFQQPQPQSGSPPPAPSQLTVRVTALVNNRNKGTPSLKPAVKCIGFAEPTDTDIDLASP